MLPKQIYLINKYAHRRAIDGASDAEVQFLDDITAELTSEVNQLKSKANIGSRQKLLLMLQMSGMSEVYNNLNKYPVLFLEYLIRHRFRWDNSFVYDSLGLAYCYWHKEIEERITCLDLFSAVSFEGGKEFFYSLYPDLQTPDLFYTWEQYKPTHLKHEIAERLLDVSPVIFSLYGNQ